MDINKLQRKLMAAARCEAPDERVPYAFEKRVLARIIGQPAPDSLALWARALWRAAASCLVITVALCSWTLLSPKPPHIADNDLRQDLENTLLASMPADSEISW